MALAFHRSRSFLLLNDPTVSAHIHLLPECQGMMVYFLQKETSVVPMISCGEEVV